MASRGIARFLVLFGAYLLSGYLLLGTAWMDRLFVLPWTHANVRTAVVLARPLGIRARAVGTTITARDGAMLEANKGCDGINALLLLATTILAFPASWRSRAVGLLLGTVAVFGFNAIRIASLLLVAVRWPARLDFFHVDLWQPAMVLISFALFFVWGGWLARGRPRRILRG